MNETKVGERKANNTMWKRLRMGNAGNRKIEITSEEWRKWTEISMNERRRQKMSVLHP
jgi:hypothetical protein